MQTVILTGGASRRMGRDKALLPWGGTTFLQHLIGVYSVLGPVAVSVDRAGRFPFTGAQELVDTRPGMGPLNGIVSGFAETKADVLLLTGTDLPFGDPALALRLEALREGADACILQRGKKGIEPLFALYARPCRAAAEACLNAGRRSFFAMLDALTVRYVTPEELPEFDLESILRNVNTPEEYEAAFSASFR